MLLSLTLIFLLFLSMAESACPSGYRNLFGRHCYKLYDQLQNDYILSKRVCEQDGAELVSIHSKEENKALQLAAARKGVGFFWIGIECTTNDDEHWTDGTPFDYTNFGDQPTDGDCNPNNRWQFSVSPGFWISYRKTDTDTTAFCKIPNAARKCPDGYLNQYADNCYHFAEKTGRNYSEAKQYCQKKGGDLVSIHSLEENTAVQDASGSLYLGYIWLGIECTADNVFSWTDGTPFNYNNFEQGADQCDQNAAYQMHDTSGEWSQYPLEDDEAYAACEIEHNAVITTTLSSSDCDAGYSLNEVANTCVRVVAQNSTWSQAESACATDGAHLVSIHSRTENDYLRRLALSYSVTDGVFIGLRSDENDHIFWSDQSPFTYSNAAPGQFDTTLGYCTKMDTGSGLWYSVQCDDTDILPYICAKTTNL